MAAVTPTIIKGDKIGVRGNKQVNVLKSLWVETANTVDAADTIDVMYADHGISTVLGVRGYKHTTDGSVVVTENPTTSVTSGVMTLTVPAGTDDDKRVYQLFYI